ncbi:hypothetical protein [Dyella sp. A6]|uniref:hypothetical protein n=1 Tax=Dyella aluminiiresistens TaxID=3069105 RepID=UPI002E7A4E72|nr:hypothetical protein [Dyella sp. A6]
MNAQVTFQTDFFRASLGEESMTNPGRIGRDLAFWLQRELRTRGVESAEVIAEDFGWVVMIARKPWRLWLGCGNTDDSLTEWSIFVVAEASVFKRLLDRETIAEATRRLWEHVEALVHDVPGVRNIAWS